MRRLAVAAAIALALAGCGGASAPIAVPSEELPFDLRRTVEPTESEYPSRRITVFFVRDGRLVPVRRAITSERTLHDAALRELLEGPTPSEKDRGVWTAVPQKTELLEAFVEGGVALVDLSTEFQAPGPSDRILLRVAQVVWTMVRFEHINAVQFVIEGEIVPVVTARRGPPVARPVGASDYARIAPPP